MKKKESKRDKIFDSGPVDDEEEYESEVSKSIKGAPFRKVTPPGQKQIKAKEPSF